MMGPQGAVSPNFQRQRAVAGEGPRQIGTPRGVRLDLFSGLWERRGRDYEEEGEEPHSSCLFGRDRKEDMPDSAVGWGWGYRTDHYSGEM